MSKGGKKNVPPMSPAANRLNTAIEGGPAAELLSVAYFDKRLLELTNTLASKEDLCALKEIIKEQKTVITSLQTRVETLEAQVTFLLDETERSQQYSRRQCLRIDGVALPANEASESSQDVLKAVHKVITEAGIDIPDHAIDRAHRIGRTKIVGGRRHRQIIVKFSTFRYRTMLYWARKTVAPKIKISLDLTKNRKEVLDKINSYLREKNADNSFAFADINCELMVKLKTEFHHIYSFDDFLRLIGEASGE